MVKGAEQYSNNDQHKKIISVIQMTSMFTKKSLAI